jgi:8-oxo-dGTP pyrophosphatase MutT (NUDIX family)
LFLMADVVRQLRRALPHPLNTPFRKPPAGFRNAAVLVPLQRDSGAWRVLYTVRSERLGEHRGEIAFPGSQPEAGDAGPLQTALREACEEVGIDPRDVEPLGILDPVDTGTGFRIRPVVGVIAEGAAVRPSLPEVSGVFRVPLDWLQTAGRREGQPVHPPAGDKRAIFFEDFNGRVIWGATARITVQLLDLLREG